jgi:hypothetical protein
MPTPDSLETDSGEDAADNARELHRYFEKATSRNICLDNFRGR